MKRSLVLKFAQPEIHLYIFLERFYIVITLYSTVQYSYYSHSQNRSLGDLPLTSGVVFLLSCENRKQIVSLWHTHVIFLAVLMSFEGTNSITLGLILLRRHYFMLFNIFTFMPKSLKQVYMFVRWKAFEAAFSLRLRYNSPLKAALIRSSFRSIVADKRWVSFKVFQ